MIITKLAFEEAKKENIEIQRLIGKGSGELGRVNVWDIHRIAHPPNFRYQEFANNGKTHLSNDHLDELFEKKFGGKNQRSIAIIVDVSKDSAPTSIQKDSIQVASRRRIRKTGDIVNLK